MWFLFLFIYFDYFLVLFQRVGLDIPTIEVRFEHLSVEAEAYVGGRALPTVFNFSINMFEVYILFMLFFFL